MFIFAKTVASTTGKSYCLEVTTYIVKYVLNLMHLQPQSNRLDKTNDLERSP